MGCSSGKSAGSSTSSSKYVEETHEAEVETKANGDAEQKREAEAKPKARDTEPDSKIDKADCSFPGCSCECFIPMDSKPHICKNCHHVSSLHDKTGPPTSDTDWGKVRCMYGNCICQGFSASPANPDVCQLCGHSKPLHQNTWDAPPQIKPIAPPAGDC